MTGLLILKRLGIPGSFAVSLLLCALQAVAVAQGVDELPTEAAQVEASIRSGQWDEALRQLQPLEAAHPDNLRLLNLQGLALTGAGRRAEAIATFSHCLTIRPGYFPALKNLGINEFLVHQDTQAEAHLKQALAAAPNDRAVSLYLGQLAFAHGDHVQAEALLARAGDLVLQNPEATAEFVCSQLEINPPGRLVLYRDRISPRELPAPLQFQIGVALLHAGRPSEAVAFLEAARPADGLRNDLEFDLVVAEIGAHRFDDAIVHAKSLIAAGAESSELQNLAAEAYEGMHRTQNAVDALRRAIALDPKAEQNYLDFAALCLNHQSYAQGLTVLNVGIQLDPQSDRLYFERGILFAAQDQFDSAEKDFARAGELAPQKDAAALGLGVTYLQSGNASSAVRVVRQRLKSAPDDPQLQCLLGEALLKTGAAPGTADYQEAEHSLSLAVADDPALELAHVLLGSMYVQQGRDEQAVAELEHAKTLKPSDRAVYSHLAVAYRHLHETDKMQAALATLRALNDRERGEAPNP